MNAIIQPPKQLIRAACMLLIAACALSAHAQVSGPVATGIVKNSKGESLPNVAVFLQNEGNEAVASGMTNEKGVFTFSDLPIGGPYRFIFSHVGFVSDTLPGYKVHEKTRISVSVILRLKNEELNTVVVTALGIRREEKSLGYSAQTVKENAVQDAKTNNWVNALSGKVAGLNIQGAGAGPMGSSRITLRGESSLNLDNNQALIIVDGVPVSKRITGTGYSSHLSADNPVDFGSDLSDLNPDDIEKVTILKGAGATALYGSRAAGGAILITTKSGTKKEKGIGITYNSNVSIDQVNRWPDYQYEYGEGRTDKYYSYGNSADGTNTSTTVAAGRAFGPKFDGQMYFQYSPDAPDNKPTERTPWVADKNYIKGFFRTGLTITNSLAIEGGNDRGTARLSLTHMKNQWILPNTGYERINASLSVNQKVSNRLKINGKVNYTNKKSDNLPGAGYNNQSIMYFLIIGTAPNIRPNWFKPYWQTGLENVRQKNPFNTGPDNPYLDLYEMLNKMNKHGVIGTLSASYEISPKLELLVRTGTDLSFEFRSQQRPFSMTKFPNGSYREQNIFNYEVNTDALLTYNDRISKDLRFSVSAGGNAMRSTYDFAGMYADQLAQPGVYMISNSLDPAVSDPQKSRKSINSLYATAQFNFQEKIFFDVTSRNDWSSSLPHGSNSYFYPSFSTSLLLNEMLRLPSQVSFAKLRLSWSQVGNDTDPYKTAKYYDKIYSNNLTNPGTMYNPDLKPEITTSYEAGLDLRLLNGRIGIDATVYNNNSRNQIIAIPVDPVSGFSNKVVNAGLINSKGIELVLTGKPVVNKNFGWTTTLNWSMNRSYVKELAEGITSQVMYAHSDNVTIEARVGGRMGDMYGKGFLRNEEGKIVYSSVGVPATLDPVVKKWGNAFPDWKAGLMNEFTIHDFRFSFLLDGQKGGSMYSQTNHKNNTLGKTKVTLPGRDGGIVGDGVVWDATGNKYVPNAVNVSAATYYETFYAISNAETNIFDASYLKLREVRIEYNLPRKWIDKLRLQQTSIALYGRDLFNITSFPGFDPEGGNLNSGTLTPGVELTQFPSTRTMGINLTVKF